MERMQLRWQALGNTCSLELGRAWRSTAELFNEYAEGRSQGIWKALPMPTGSGKTQCVVLYCAMLKSNEHPGVLVVTPFKTQASDIANQINALAGDDRTVASHRDPLIGLEAVYRAPVLTITHSAFQNSVTHRADGKSVRLQHSQLTEWSQGLRRLTIIDEAPAFVRCHRATLSDIAVMCGAVLGAIPSTRQCQLAELEALILALKVAKAVGDDRERFLTELEIGLLKDINVGALLDTVSCTDADAFQLGRDDGIDGGNLRARCQSTLRSLINIQRLGAPWISQRGHALSMHASECAFPIEGSGIILDATARVDPTYDLLGSRVMVTRTDSHLRSYSNVTLRIATNRNVGKEHLTKNFKLMWKSVVAELKKEVSTENRVLICCHKAVEQFISSQDCSFAHVSTAHWGKINGFNDWSDFDTVVILGLPYLDQAVSAEQFMGLRGPTNDDWLRNAAFRQFGKHADVRQALKTGHIVKSVIQAISRVRCRRTIDSLGNCARTRIFMLLPGGQVAESITSALEYEMNGIKIAPWEVGAWTRKVRQSFAQRHLKNYLFFATPGVVYTKKHLIETEGFPKTTLDRFINSLKNENSDNSLALKELGIEYVSPQKGRGFESHFVKRMPGNESQPTPISAFPVPIPVPAMVSDALFALGLST